MRHVELKREGKVLADFDLYALLVKGDKTGTYNCSRRRALHPQRVHRWRSWAAVRQEAIYELRGEQTIEELLEPPAAERGGFGGRISVERSRTMHSAEPSN